MATPAPAPDAALSPDQSKDAAPPLNSDSKKSVMGRLLTGCTFSETNSMSNDVKRDTGTVVNARVFCCEGTNSRLEVLLSFVGQEGKEVGAPVDLSKFKSIPWRVKVDDKNEVTKGLIYEGQVDVPAAAVPDLIVLRVKPKASVDKEYINKIEITKDRDGSLQEVISVAPNTWVHSRQGGRHFFAKTLALLPSQTPASLKAWRQAELDAAKGTMVERALQREEWDRIYEYDVYNDLAGREKSGKVVEREVLGGRPEFPYPRRLRTGRARAPDASGALNYETRDAPGGDFWTPLDDNFNFVKEVNFKSYGLLAAIPTVAETLKRKLFDHDHKLSSFAEVNTMYARLEDKDLEMTHKELMTTLNSESGLMGRLGHRLYGIEEGIKLKLPLLGAIGSSVENIKKLVGGAQHLLDFPPPLVVQGRGTKWDSDQEWGRQALAGVNPSCIRALTSATQLGGITPAHLAPALEGASLDSLLAAAATQPRLLVIDHTSVFEDYAQRITAQGKDRYGHWGRAVLYQDNTKHWTPIAIELSGSAGEHNVLTPSSSSPAVWRLARGVFTSIDSAYHQLVTHWLRCHAATEPYIIATHRCLSSIHPVYKMMMPHWAFTLRINANARSSLINATGIIESTFTPGRYAIEMSSKWYAAEWRFNTQGLPDDLVARGLAKRGEDGKVQLLLKDYPYADDGMLLWDAVYDWAGQYLALYYNDATEGVRVTDDEELMAWWKEIVEVGHGDMKEGWPTLATIADLAHILTTMIWVASAHHAAINFSQYAYSGYILNRPSICTRGIPDEAGREAMSKTHAAGERAYVDTLCSDATLKAILTMELLSTHADTEVYMGDPNHQYILEEQALKLYQEHAARVRRIEEAVKERNADPERLMRHDLAYESLAPGSVPGLTNRGVPQSVSI